AGIANGRTGDVYTTAGCKDHIAGQPLHASNTVVADSQAADRNPRTAHQVQRPALTSQAGNTGGSDVCAGYVNAGPACEGNGAALAIHHQYATIADGRATDQNTAAASQTNSAALPIQG